MRNSKKLEVNDARTELLAWSWAWIIGLLLLNYSEEAGNERLERQAYEIVVYFAVVPQLAMVQEARSLSFEMEAAQCTKSLYLLEMG